MPTHARQLLVIITEAALEKNLIKAARQHGAQGYTIYDVRGGGQHGTREDSWEADRSIEMKVICTQEVAQQLSQYILTTYCPHYSVSMFIAEVSVLRPEKY
ncbi:P-II family nitrogen regulator [Parvibium lacunae]|uniref:Transcriptional regulator n=1 Tax=Parvibium lacunae TaxID=1888893 RepID=A0A368L7M3_9BURK|nr:transcriptional regulator [Parvibium lacunae]RCS59614.1 transcriptional regulator [Parvibium lacunae]